ncbi:peptidyl-prolyl cis-trans isomerase [Mycoplasma sp. CAG:877]|nr:peptidyl-prolyl cis-trans isomerase [Mycoplasma sp. CAG:877]
MKNKLFILLTIILASTLLTACSSNKTKEIKEDLLGIDFNTETNEVELSQYETENPVVAMYIENYGAIVIELYPDIAPNTVANFISLTKSNFYDNNTMHRLVPGFVLQGGDPTGTGTGGPGYTIKGEFSANDFENNLKHEKGIVSMARTSVSNDTAGSQFFIMLGTASYLDGQYAAFGKVIDGWSNIENIINNEQVQNQETGQLKNNLVIKKTLIDLKGKEYQEVEKISE